MSPECLCSVVYFVGVEEIHSVGTINNVETSYFTQVKICYLMTAFRCTSDVLITSWSSVWGSRNIRMKWTLSQLVHRPEPPGQGKQCNSQVSHHRPCRGREPCHRLGQGKSGRQRGTATDQMDTRGTLDQEDTDVHESGCKILPTQPHMGPGDFQVTCSIKL